MERAGPPKVSGTKSVEAKTPFNMVIPTGAHKRFILESYESALVRTCFAIAKMREYAASLPSENVLLHLAETAGRSVQVTWICPTGWRSSISI